MSMTLALGAFLKLMVEIVDRPAFPTAMMALLVADLAPGARSATAGVAGALQANIESGLAVDALLGPMIAIHMVLVVRVGEAVQTAAVENMANDVPAVLNPIDAVAAKPALAMAIAALLEADLAIGPMVAMAGVVTAM